MFTLAGALLTGADKRSNRAAVWRRVAPDAGCSAFHSAVGRQGCIRQPQLGVTGDRHQRIGDFVATPPSSSPPQRTGPVLARDRAARGHLMKCVVTLPSSSSRAIGT